MTSHAYMLRCADGSFYVGTTRASLEQRVAQHASGSFGGYTAARRPVTLVWCEEFADVRDAIAAERRIKGWSRAKKQALIEGDIGRLRALARGRSRPVERPDPADLPC
ncbi:MAG: GIY-YIG nuclease family protein [Thalassobaculales bacterium]